MLSYNFILQIIRYSRSFMITSICLFWHDVVGFFWNSKISNLSLVFATKWIFGFNGFGCKILYGGINIWFSYFNWTVLQEFIFFMKNSKWHSNIVSKTCWFTSKLIFRYFWIGWSPMNLILIWWMVGIRVFCNPRI